MGRHSSSESDYSRSSSSKRKKKSSRKRRSRSPSYSNERRSHSKSRRSRSRSLTSDPGRSSRSSKRKRSRSRDRSYESKLRESSSRRRSRSSSPPVRRKKHVDAVLGVSTGTLKDILDIVPGFSKMTPAEQSKIRTRRALNAAVESAASNNQDEERNVDICDEDPELDIKEQIERAKAIQAIGDDDDYDADSFLPSHFRSSKKKDQEISNHSGKKSFSDRESSHEIAIFGHSSMLTIDEALKQKKETDDKAFSKAKRMVDFSQRDPKTLLASNLLISPHEAALKWRSKLISLSQRFADDLASA